MPYLLDGRPGSFALGARIGFPPFRRPARARLVRFAPGDRTLLQLPAPPVRTDGALRGVREVLIANKVLPAAGNRDLDNGTVRCSRDHGFPAADLVVRISPSHTRSKIVPTT